MRTLAIITIVAMLLGGGLTEWARAERHSLPRTFEHARLGMAFDEWTQTSGAVKVSRADGPRRHVVERPSNRYLRRIEYGFVGNRLEQISIHYTVDRLPARGNRMAELLSEVYGRPDRETEDFVPGPLLSEKKWVWDDGRTRVMLIERMRLDSDTASEVELRLIDTALEAAEAARLQEEERRKLDAVPIPRPDGGRMQTATHGQERPGRSS